MGIRFGWYDNFGPCRHRRGDMFIISTGNYPVHPFGVGNWQHPPPACDTGGFVNLLVGAIWKAGFFKSTTRAGGELKGWSISGKDTRSRSPYQAPPSRTRAANLRWSTACGRTLGGLFMLSIRFVIPRSRHSCHRRNGYPFGGGGAVREVSRLEKAYARRGGQLFRSYECYLKHFPLSYFSTHLI